jgi:hypothetical protein
MINSKKLSYQLFAIIVLLLVVTFISYGNNLLSITGFSVFPTSSENEVSIIDLDPVPDLQEIFEEPGPVESIKKETLNKSNNSKPNSSSGNGFKVVSNDFPTSNGNSGTNSGNGLVVENIYLGSPLKNSGFFEGVINFSYLIELNNINFCELIFQNSTEELRFNISKNQTYNLVNLSSGRYQWHIECIGLDLDYYSKRINFRVFKKLEGVEFPEDILKNGLGNVKNFYIKDEKHGLIEFLEDLNLTGLEDFNNNLFIKHNFIEIKSKNLPQLNKSAKLTFQNLDFENPIILRDGKPCLDCEIISYDSFGLTFLVNHFTNYSATENSQLKIWDDSDHDKFGGSFVRFYANYTNVSDETPIIGASCIINFSDEQKTMQYNSSSKLYESNKTFALRGIHDYNVSCSKVDFTTINLSDYVSLDVLGGPNGVTFTVTSNSTMTLSSPGNHSSIAGNLTQISVDAEVVSQFWQGYYGRITGEISLKNSQGHVFYDWNSTIPDGEVYASRASDVNFVSIHCATLSEINSEESSLGQISSEPESVSNTFNKKNHPAFYTGNSPFNSNDCNSTNIFVNSLPQLTNFYEVIMSDNASNIIYTSILENSISGFDSNPHDFQMLVSEDGKGNTITTLYYFYIELS